MDIRPEIRLDARAIDEVHASAFPDGGTAEVQMVHDLRADEEAFVPELSLVAVINATMVRAMRTASAAAAPRRIRAAT